MTHTALTELFGVYRLIIEPAEGYTMEDGVLTVSVWHTKQGLIDCHTDGMTLRDGRDHALEIVKNHLEGTETFYMGFDEVEIKGLHGHLVLLKDSTDYIIASQTAFIYARLETYSVVRDYAMNNRYTGFSRYFNANDIHHAEGLI